MEEETIVVDEPATKLADVKIAEPVIVATELEVELPRNSEKSCTTAIAPKVVDHEGADCPLDSSASCGLGLPRFRRGIHVPVLGILNPRSGNQTGTALLQLCQKTPYYRERIFNIFDVCRDARAMDMFRGELCKARAEAKALGIRPRVISGGGDGTGSFAINLVFSALRASPELAARGLRDSGNGFIWSNEEMAESFPALIQMPLGTANDFGNILGWGQSFSDAPRALHEWFTVAIDPRSKVVNFDVWGLMPKAGRDTCDFKVAQLTGQRGRCPNKHGENGARHLAFKQAGKPVPLLVCLYFSSGIGAYMTSRFELNRHNSRYANRLEYARQCVGIVAESVPPQMQVRLDQVEIDCEGSAYFPPRRNKGIRGRGYREAGFFNINWQACMFHGADRPSTLGSRFLRSKRQPVCFNDGRLDAFRWKFASFFRNPGFTIQTDKKRDFELRYCGKKGTGLFFQWDGESRFAFNPQGLHFTMYFRKALNIPVVLGPWHKTAITSDPENGNPVTFEFCGETVEDRDAVRRRILNWVDGKLEEEIIATPEEFRQAELQMKSCP